MLGRRSPARRSLREGCRSTPSKATDLASSLPCHVIVLRNEMSLAEIKSAVHALSPKELAELAAFILKQDDVAWARQIDDDSSGGKLDFLFDEADRERAAEQLRDWPEKE
jgi:hypothetical protein